jgi:hypothetical protein
VFAGHASQLASTVGLSTKYDPALHVNLGLHSNLDSYSLCQVPGGQGKQKVAMALSTHSNPARQCLGLTATSRAGRACPASVYADLLGKEETPFNCNKTTHVKVMAINFTAVIVDVLGWKWVLLVLRVKQGWWLGAWDFLYWQ